MFPLDYPICERQPAGSGQFHLLPAVGKLDLCDSGTVGWNGSLSFSDVLCTH